MKGRLKTQLEHIRMVACLFINKLYFFDIRLLLFRSIHVLLHVFSLRLMVPLLTFAGMKKWVLLVIVFIFIIPLGADGQCAMCKAVAETSQQGGSSVADGLNSGIMYLMAFPYLIMGAVGLAIYRYKKPRS